VDEKKVENLKLLKTIGDLGMNYFEEITFVVISPSLVSNWEFSFVLEALTTPKLRLS